MANTTIKNGKLAKKIPFQILRIRRKLTTKNITDQPYYFDKKVELALYYALKKKMRMTIQNIYYIPL